MLRLVPWSLLLATLVLSLACSGPNPPAGKWQLNGAKTYAANQAVMIESMQDAPEAERTKALSDLRTIFDALDCEVDLRSNGSFRGTMELAESAGGYGPGPPITGTWTSEGNAVTITTEGNGGETFRHEGTWTPETLDVLWTANGQNRRLVFDRKD